MRQFNCRINNRSLNRRPRLTEVQVGCPLNPADLPEPGLASGLDARSRWSGNRTEPHSLVERDVSGTKKRISVIIGVTQGPWCKLGMPSKVQAYRRIRKLIENGHLEAGEQVTETKARLIGMSRGPVRESLLCLDGSIFRRIIEALRNTFWKIDAAVVVGPLLRTLSVSEQRPNGKYRLSLLAEYEKIMNPRQRVISASIATGTTVPVKHEGTPEVNQALMTTSGCRTWSSCFACWRRLPLRRAGLLWTGTQDILRWQEGYFASTTRRPV